VTTLVYWKGGNGNWTDATQWTSGAVPDSTDTVALEPLNESNLPAYTVDLDSAATVRVVSVGASYVTFDESAAGSITANEFTVVDGTVILDGINTLSLLSMNGGLVEYNSAGAVGRHTIDISAGELLATANATLHNPINDDGGTIAAAAGVALRLDGALTTAPNIAFGDQANTATGTIQIIDPTLSDNIEQDHGSQIILWSGRVETLAGHNQSAITLFNDAPGILIGVATLDLSNFGDDVTLRTLEGGGMIRSSNSAMELHLTNALYSGRLYGTIHVEADGTNQLIGQLDNAVITMGAGTDTLTMGYVTGHFSISAPAGSDATVVVGKLGGTYTDFQDGNLTIDTIYSSRENVTFVSSGGSTTAEIHAPSGKVASELSFTGIASSGYIAVGNDGHGRLEFTYDAAGTASLNDAQMNHDIDVANAIAAAATAHVPLDLI
jgi:hypothetical protein